MDPLRDSAHRSPGSLAVLEQPTWTYAELDRGADAIATGLLRSGVTGGDLVGMRLPPSAESVALFFGIVRVGAVVVSLNATGSESEARGAAEALAVVRLVIDDRRLVRAWLESEGSKEVGAHGESSDLAPDDPAAMVLTSGSGGVPRPITITHGNLAASASRVVERLGLRRDDRWLTSLSLAHIGGLTLIHRAVVLGCALFTQPRFEAKQTAGLIDAGEVTHASLVPVMLRRLMDERGDRPPPASLKCLLVGGAATALPTLDRGLAMGYPISLTYGLTETTSQVATATPDQVRAKPGSVGQPLSGLDVRIEESDGAEGRGEILVRGPTVADGPLREPESDGTSPHVDGEGWLHTGDLGYLDAEGDLWITGRASFRIVTGGITVEPGEVETVLMCHPGVREVAVLGCPDPEWGERVVALIVPEDPLWPPTLPELLEFTRSRLGSAKRPRELRVVASLPRTALGKLDRRRIGSL